MPASGENGSDMSGTLPRQFGENRRPRLCLPAIVAALSLAFFAADVRGDARAGLFDPRWFTLDNGLRVVVISDHRAPVVTHMIWYKVGAADDPRGKSGLAHYLEHMMFKGTRNVPAGEFSRTVARLGGEENAFTGHDYTGYYQTIASRRLETVMRLEADRMTNLVVRGEDVAAEREVVREERRSRLGNDPGALLAEQMSAAQFLSHHLLRPVHHVLEDLVQRRADVDVAVRVRRSVVEDERLAALRSRPQPGVEVEPGPAPEQFRFAPGQPGAHGKVGPGQEYRRPVVGAGAVGSLFSGGHRRCGFRERDTKKAERLVARPSAEGRDRNSRVFRDSLAHYRRHDIP